MSRLGLGEARLIARRKLTTAAENLQEDDPLDVQTAIGGLLLRPIAGYDVAAQLRADDEPFWLAALAVQLAHEASLVHDDLIDEAPTRRSIPTRAAAAGPAAAVLEGDQLLAAAYAAAALTRSGPFTEHFARTVRRTIAAERRQGECRGERIPIGTYEAIAAGKSGELIGCAIAAAPLLAGDESWPAVHALGLRIGLLYQMVDDLVDYCPSSQAGKRVMGDYARQCWTWPLDVAPDVVFGEPNESAAARMRRPRPEWGGATALKRCLERLEQRFDEVRAACRALLPGHFLLDSLLAEWLQRVRDVVGREEQRSGDQPRSSVPRRPLRPSQALAARTPMERDARRFLSRHSRSFFTAVRFMTPEQAGRIARVYSFCRVTDDLADRSASAQEAERLLDEWVWLARSAYDGDTVRLSLVDRTMRDMAGASVPFSYVEELAEGMRMDLRGTTYASLDELQTYTRRAASVVGLWVAQLAGVRDHHLLSNAARMGHAMQLTNIVRDVGEDWAGGRLYLPAELLCRHGMDPRSIGDLYDGRRPVDAAYRDVLEEMMKIAASEYRAAFPWICALPPFLQRPVAVAARVYEGIHDAIRRNGYDNIHRRAATSALRKTALIALGLRDLERARSAGAGAQAKQVYTNRAAQHGDGRLLIAHSSTTP